MFRRSKRYYDREEREEFREEEDEEEDENETEPEEEEELSELRRVLIFEKIRENF